MPYIYCPRCGSGCYTNVRSCPNCRMPLRPEHRRRVRYRLRKWLSPPAGEDVEARVREALYGWHSGCVERYAEQEDASTLATRLRPGRRGTRSAG